VEALKLAAVGLGYWGPNLARNLDELDGAELAWICDRDEARLERYGARFSAARKTTGYEDVLADPELDAVAIATPVVTHFELAREALLAGKHVFVEKPLALDDAEARDLVATVERTGKALLVDHVLRYNPLLHALTRLRGSLLGPVQRFCFENDASDEDLDPEHWFWDVTRSGGIFVEHGVHFFDAAAMLIDAAPTSVQAVAVRRADGPVDLVSATVVHGDALATHTHSFTHAHRCERQLMRLDCGAAEVRVEGWIPVLAVIDAWTDDAGLRVAEGLPARAYELLHVDGFRFGPETGIRVSSQPDAALSGARARGVTRELPHRVRVELTLGGHDAKPTAYAESVRAAMTDLVARVADGGAPASGVAEGAAAVAMATAATRAARSGRAEPLVPTPVPAR
jgi:predicted dehydrogenase